MASSLDKLHLRPLLDLFTSIRTQAVTIMEKRVKRRTKLNHPVTMANTELKVRTMIARRAPSPITTQARRS